MDESNAAGGLVGQLNNTYQIDGGVECEEDMGDDGEAVHPQRPRVHQVALRNCLKVGRMNE